ncbi:unnamed protein product [Rotaria sordida]|uniref:Uncharacterized protein n=1 Tax=Rotaria sordida TaxID=392033 RepID=A0A819P0Y1_9BILA|nr:unnamed protein product [Rotaria sordida]CAF0998795.1 unnamed protein product [Rotaria sordida]CAF1040545.1 unnamed protein product [Rotaria sordida]CAF1089954.1 unnamed protein product [Rotaria sordida]CAF1186147.1 unnamed protein product [Rotaria sordida]
MALLILILTIISIFLLSLAIIYALIYFRENLKSSSSSYENQRLTYSTQPSIDIIPKKLICPLNFSNHRNLSNINLNQQKSNQLRSHSLTNNLFITKCSYRRRCSIIDSKQIAQIEFSLPPTAEKIRRRSVPICNNINESKQSTIDSIIKTIKLSNQFLPCLASFSIIYYKSSQIKIYFHSLTSLPSTIQLQQLTIQVKLIPDGKIKYFSIKNILNNKNIFAQDNNEYLIQFSNILLTKLHNKTILMKFYGKDQTKKTIELGQIGKIYFNQINNFENEQSIHFIHEIEIIRISSIEILVLLEQNNDHHLTVEIQRIKGLKIDQKNSIATCYFQVILLDRHRRLSTHQTKFYRLNSSTFSLNESFNINILAFNSNNLDRIMIMINLYSNTNNTNEHRCVGRVKLASPYFCSGSGTIHWQQFKQRQSFSMWHKLIKQN